MKEREDAQSEFAGGLDQFARFLDPHLSAPVEVRESFSAERWPVLKSLIFIFGTSIAIWAAVIALIYYLF